MSKISQLLTNKTSLYSPPLSTEPNAVGIISKELVNHPQHYQSKNGIEAIDVIEAFDLGFNLGNVIKYILRAGKKDATVQELEKAKWYLDREINKLKEN